ncbi:hypothetical protein [Kutzneria sp. CA-103260]|uniref:hypothetical protein n=1 Tax=Kutzneria sp. CA-103260 TaxID=2802641 RepID=UPI001BADABD0|nr:hypothetical protein [Kutzneria sp. CA-103260]QUQ69043.1 hypothetical protein JJ691_67970 [Kutzneria sp. CA-103260]
MFTTKMRAVAGIALAATAALTFAGAAQAGPLKPNAADQGDVQLLTTDGNASLVHTIRHSDGSWQQFGRIDGYAGVTGLTSTLVSGEENVFFQYTSPKGPLLAHFIRHADGTWNWAASTPAQAAGATVDDLSATTVNGKIVLLQQKDGAVKESTQGTDGTWSPWTDVPANGQVRSAAAASYGGTLSVVELSADGKSVTEYDQYSDGSWSAPRSTTVNDYSDYTATKVAVEADYNGVQVGLVETYYNFNVGVYHSILHSGTGSWDHFRSVQNVLNNYYAVQDLSMTTSYGQMHLTFSSTNGQLFHTIRDANGNWQPAGDVESVAGNVTAGQVTIAGYTF